MDRKQDEQTAGWTYKWMDRPMNRWMDEQKDKRMSKQMDGQINKQTETDKEMDGWIVLLVL